MAITRRVFLKSGALAIVGTAAIPSFLQRAAWGAQTRGGRKKLVVLFQRGAADGLNIVVPHGESSSYAMRPSIAIPRPGNGGAIDLDGFCGLHPAMNALKPLWEQRHLAIIHAAGSPDTTRSHFDAQDYMESGTPGLKGTEDGWLNRAVAERTAGERSAAERTNGERSAAERTNKEKQSPFRAIALGPT